LPWCAPFLPSEGGAPVSPARWDVFGRLNGPWAAKKNRAFRRETHGKSFHVPHLSFPPDLAPFKRRLPWFHRAVPSATLDKDIYLTFIVSGIAGLSRAHTPFFAGNFSRSGQCSKNVGDFFLGRGYNAL
jgi:hypothetical protein